MTIIDGYLFNWHTSYIYRITSNMKKLLLTFIIVFVFGSVGFSQKKVVKSVKKSNQTKLSNFAVLSFATGIDFQFGGVQKVSRGEFLLLDSDWNSILEHKYDSIAKYFSRMSQISKLYELAGDNQDAFSEIAGKTQAHIVASTLSDFNGIGKFKSVKPGTYWLANYSQMRGNAVVWNVQVTLKQGRNVVILDQNNASIAPLN